MKTDVFVLDNKWVVAVVRDDGLIATHAVDMTQYEDIAVAIDAAVIQAIDMFNSQKYYSLLFETEFRTDNDDELPPR